MIFALGAHGHTSGRYYHEHPWIFVSMIGILIVMMIWNKFSR